MGTAISTSGRAFAYSSLVRSMLDAGIGSGLWERSMGWPMRGVPLRPEPDASKEALVNHPGAKTCRTPPPVNLLLAFHDHILALDLYGILQGDIDRAVFGFA